MFSESNGVFPLDGSSWDRPGCLKLAGKDAHVTIDGSDSVGELAFILAP
ncbi:MAG: hypothetical protein ABIT01_12630 [Thermoanaerobaculia bacterium]